MLSVSIGVAHAQPEPLQAGTADVPPWGLIGDSGEPQGLLVEFQALLAERAGLPVTSKLLPYPRVIRDLAMGNADMGVMFVSPSAEEVGFSLGEVVTIGVVALVPASAGEFTGLDDFAGLRVGFVRGSKYGAQFDNNPRFERIGVHSADQGLQMLSMGRLDVMVATEQALAFGLYRKQLESSLFKVALSVGVTRADLYVNHEKLTAPWVPQVRNALTALRADGSLHRLFYQHDMWPRSKACFERGRCLATQAPVKTQEK
ncbi:polar amino acid transport system substrate-binding protein [Simiduia aestuariiviva]|uniref:Polar amino acid transport system substrate-binding protein n=2 Tax=Simiduia aestuariiviva TaxID=1510459 RepID=A0A839UU20_9GAMM|nr:polar amino acid transport system substrate-binding protein [Simiduia aestuariiviva]